MTAYNFSLHTYPFSLAVTNQSSALYQAIKQLYPTEVFQPFNQQQFYDFDLNIKKRRRILGVEFHVGSASEHFRMSEPAHLPAIFEWAFNWSVASFQHHYLSIHAAVLQKGAVTLVMPAAPGSGKSTLAAMLMLEGWRLLSDETCFIDTISGAVLPSVRPISLKNNSLQVIKQRYADAPLKFNITNTIKGTIGYLLPSQLSWQLANQACRATHIIFPLYQAEANSTTFNRLTPSNSFMQLAINSFNYSVLGLEGFNALSQLVNSTQAFELIYADSDHALALLAELR